MSRKTKSDTAALIFFTYLNLPAV